MFMTLGYGRFLGCDMTEDYFIESVQELEEKYAISLWTLSRTPEKQEVENASKVVVQALNDYKARE